MQRWPLGLPHTARPTMPWESLSLGSLATAFAAKAAGLPVAAVAAPCFGQHAMLVASTEAPHPQAAGTRADIRPDHVYVVAVITTALALLVVCLKVAGGSVQSSERPWRSVAVAGFGDKAEAFLRRLGAPEHPHEEASFVPTFGLIVSNREGCDRFENDNCCGSFLSLHRATYDKQLDASGHYPYGKYFMGKKRLWEARVQLRFKRSPPAQSDMFFGIELEQYVAMGRGSKRSMDMLVGMLKRVVGNQIYHSIGDDPRAVSGPPGDLERPVFVMPLWAFDQFIVTPEGEAPPSLTDPTLPSMGSVRVKRVKEFQRELEELEFCVGPTYTFCFWGISQWLDKLNWQIRMPLMSPLDFNAFCGSPPVHVVIYTLKTLPGRDGERRHLQDRKRYFFHLAFWSSKSRPPAGRMRELLGLPAEPATDARPPATGFGRPAWQNSSWSSCCGPR